MWGSLRCQWVYLLCHISTQPRTKSARNWAMMRVEIYERDAVVVGLPGPQNGVIAKREEVTEFTYKSRKRLAFVANNTQAELTVMVTLTYPSEYPSDGKLVKRHLNTFLTWARRRGVADYLWFVEFQKRGAPHFHVVVDIPLDKREVARRWYEIVGSEDQKHLKAGTRVERLRSKDGIGRYAAKYAYKMEQKTCPPDYRNMGRFWGHSRGVKPEKVAETPLTAETLEYVLARTGKIYATIFNGRALLLGDPEQPELADQAVQATPMSPQCHHTVTVPP